MQQYEMNMQGGTSRSTLRTSDRTVNRVGASLERPDDAADEGRRED